MRWDRVEPRDSQVGPPIAMVRRVGFEPTSPCGRQGLGLLRFPISTPPRTSTITLGGGILIIGHPFEMARAHPPRLRRSTQIGQSLVGWITATDMALTSVVVAWTTGAGGDGSGGGGWNALAGTVPPSSCGTVTNPNPRFS